MIMDIVDKIRLHQKRLSHALEEIQGWDELVPEMFDDFEKVKTIDTFIYRFSKMQDMMGDKLFKLFLDEIGEYKESMSLVDVLDKLEKFQIIEDGSEWMMFRKLRNQLMHEYPNNEDEILEGILLAIEAYDKMLMIFDKIVAYHRRVR